MRRGEEGVGEGGGGREEGRRGEGGVDTADVLVSLAFWYHSRPYNPIQKLVTGEVGRVVAATECGGKHRRR